MNYRLIGEAIFPEPVKDVKMAIRFIKKYASKFQFDPNEMGNCGGSAVVVSYPVSDFSRLEHDLQVNSLLGKDYAKVEIFRNAVRSSVRFETKENIECIFDFVFDFRRRK